MSKALIIVAQPFDCSRISPASLTLAALRTRQVGAVVVDLGPITERESDAPNNPWMLRVRDIRGGLKVDAVDSPRDRSKLLLRVYAWLREQVRMDSPRWLHTFGPEADYVAAPLVAEFSLPWLRTAPEPAQVAAPHTLVTLQAVDWTRGLKGVGTENLVPGLSRESGMAVVLPPSGIFTPGEADAMAFEAGCKRVILLEPLPSDAITGRPVQWVTFTPANPVELLALLQLAEICLVPKCGSWLAPLAIRLGLPLLSPPGRNGGTQISDASYFDILTELGLCSSVS